MSLVELTPTEICQALGLEGFASAWKSGAPNQEMRALLLPAFHPEIHLAFAEDGAGTRVTVTCAQSKVSLFEAPSPVPVEQDCGLVADTALADFEAALRNALGEPDALTQGRDGLDINIFWRTLRAELIVQHANSSQHPALGSFVAGLISHAYQAIRCKACQDSLAEAGVYVKLDLARSHTGR